MSAQPVERIAFSAVAEAAWSAYRRVVLPAALVVTLMSLLALGVTLLVMALIEPLARLQLGFILDSDGIGVSSGGLALLIAEVAVPAGAAMAFIAAAGLSALVRLVDSGRTSGRVRTGASVVVGVRTALSVTGALLLMILVVALLALLTPFLMAVGVLGLAAFGVARMLRRTLAVRPALLVIAVIPFGAAVVAGVRLCLAPALIALEGGGPVNGLRRSVIVTGRAPALVGVATTLAFTVFIAVQLLVQASALLGASQSVVIGAGLLVQLLAFAFPVGVCAVLARDLRISGDRPVTPLPQLVHPLRMPVTASIVVVVLLFGTVTGGPLAASASDAGTPVASAVDDSEGVGESGDDYETPPDAEGEPPATPPLEEPESDDPGRDDQPEPIFGIMGEDDDEGDGGDSGSDEAPELRVDDERFVLDVIVREGPRTVVGEPMTVWATGRMSDESAAPRNFAIDVTFVDSTGAETFLGWTQHGGYGAAGFLVDPAAHPELGEPGELMFEVTAWQFVDGNERGIVGPTEVITHRLDPGAISTVTALATSTPSVILGEALSFTATVRTAENEAVTDGWVQVYDSSWNTQRAVWGQLDGNGAVTVALAGLGVNDYEFTAIYHGAPPYTTSESAPVDVAVLPYPVAIELSQSAATSEAGEAVTFTASLTAHEGRELPEGTAVSFWFGHPDTGTELHRAEQLDGVAQFTTSTLSPGVNSIYAAFEPQGWDFERAVSAPVAHGVAIIPVTLSLHSPEGWQVPAGAPGRISLAVSVPDGAPLPVTGILTVHVGADAYTIDLADTATAPDLTGPIDFYRPALEAPLTVTASFSGTATHQGAPVAATVDVRPSTTTVQLTPVIVGLPGGEHAFDARITGEVPGRVPVAGSLQYGTGSGWSSVPVVDGDASFTVTLPLGAHSVQARYVSDAPDDFEDSPVATAALDVALAPTTVSSTAPAVRVAESFMLPVTVGATAPWPAPASGVVTVEDDLDNILGSGALVEGAVEIALEGLPIGSHELTVTFAATETHASSSTRVSVLVSEWQVGVILTAAPNAISGERLELVAALTTDAPASVATPVGHTVRFSTAAGRELGSATVDADGTARVTTALAVGEGSLVAEFDGVTDALAPSSGNLTLIVTAAPTTVTLAVSPAEPTTGQQVRLTATVAVDSRSGHSAAGGTVLFTAAFLTGSNTATVDENGVAEISVPAPAPLPGEAPHVVTAQFLGTDELLGSSGTANLLTQPGHVTLTVVPQLPSVTAGNSAVITVWISSPYGAELPASGVIDLYAEDALIDTHVLQLGDGGRIEFIVDTPDTLAIGTHGLTARLWGASGIADAESEVRSFEVHGIETELRLATSPAASSEHGERVTVTATVNVVWLSQPVSGWVFLSVEGHSSQQAWASPTTGSLSVATFELDGLAIGDHTLNASFSPADSLHALASTTLAHTVTAKPVTVTSFYPQFTAGRAASVTATVTAEAPGYPLGTVQVFIDGVGVGTPVEVVPDVGSPGSSRATMAVPKAAVIAGERIVEVRYVSTDGVHSFGTLSRTVEILRAQPMLTIGTAAPVTVQWGDPFTFAVTLDRAADDAFGEVAPPTGRPTVIMETGPECETLSADRYRCVPTHPGQITVLVDYPGDAFYAPRTERVHMADATQRTPVLTVNLDTPSHQIETGAPLSLTWSLTGPGLAPVVTGLGADAHCDDAAEGSCDFRFPLHTGGTAQTVTVAFAGNAYWQPAGWTQTVTPIACYPLHLEARPAYGGTLAITDATGACAHAGYRSGARVQVTVTPTATGSVGSAWRFNGFPDQPWRGSDQLEHWFEIGVGTGQVTQVVAEFVHEMQCVPLTVVTRNTAASSGGALSILDGPNCPGAREWQSSRVANGDGSVDTIRTGMFQIGTTVQPSYYTIPGYEFYGWRSATDRERIAGRSITRQALAPFTVTGARWVEGVFGLACMPVTLSAVGPGTISTNMAANCADPARRDQYSSGTVIPLRLLPYSDDLAYLTAISNADPGEPTPFGTATERRNGQLSHTVTVRTDPVEVTAEFTACVIVTVEPATQGYGTARVTTPSNCPVGDRLLADEWRFTAGSLVGFTATPDTGAGGKFVKWNLPNPEGDIHINAINTYPHTSMHVWDDLVLRPSFVRPGMCGTLTVSSGTPGLETMVTADDSVTGICDERWLLSGWSAGSLFGEVTEGSATVTVRATEGNPLLGWVVTRPRSHAVGIPAPEVSMQVGGQLGGSSWAKAYACQIVEPYFAITDLSGEVDIALQRDGNYIEISPAPNCPHTANAWTVGTTLSFTAGADPRGYELIGWGGVAGDGSEIQGAQYVVDASAPRVAVTAAYHVVCHTLTLTGKPHRVTTVPEPNCRGGDEPALEDDVFTGQYIGGTPVALIGEVPGGNVWQGWTGDVEETGKVKVAVVIMDGDKTAAHRYRGKSWDEKAADFFTDAGNQLAVAAKKALGATAFVVGEAIKKVPPFSFVGLALTGVSLIGDFLSLIGVPDSVTKYFDYPKQTFDWVMSSYTCIAAWGLSSGDSSTDLSGARDAVNDAIGGAGSSAAGAVGIDTGGDNEPVNSALKGIYMTAKVGAKVYSKVGGSHVPASAFTAIDVGMNGFRLVTGPQGVGWDSSAAEAWSTSGAIDQITGCSEAALPSYIKDALPPDDEYWRQVEKEHGL